MIFATIDFSTVFDPVWHLPFFTNLFRLASLLALLVGLNLSFLITALEWFIKITKVTPFEFVKVFHKTPLLALYFSPTSSLTFLLLCILPSAVLFMLMAWPFGPPSPQSMLQWRLFRSSDSIGAFV